MIGGAIPICCDPELVAIAWEEAKQVDGFTSFKEAPVSLLGSEYASLMLR